MSIDEDIVNAPDGVAMAQLRGLYAECAKAGLPYSAEALVAHHRGNAALAAVADADTKAIRTVKRIRTFQQTLAAMGDLRIEEREDGLTASVKACKALAEDLLDALDKEE